VLLRPGQLARAAIEQAAGQRVYGLGESPDKLADDLAAPDPRAPGTLTAHYAPRAQVRLMNAEELRAALGLLSGQANGSAGIAPVAVWARTPLPPASCRIILRRMPDDAPTAAQQLFAVLRGFDDAGVKLIWIETPPAAPQWEGIADRLRRAAASA
jgi:L-threonylcarbamoyladenylate synthase